MDLHNLFFARKRSGPLSICATVHVTRTHTPHISTCFFPHMRRHNNDLIHPALPKRIPNELTRPFRAGETNELRGCADAPFRDPNPTCDPSRWSRKSRSPRLERFNETVSFLGWTLGDTARSPGPRCRFSSEKWLICAYLLPVKE